SAAGATFVISTFASSRVDEIARAARGRAWFQLYVQRDRGVTKDLVQRAEAAGCTALCITVDGPVVPMRDRETRLGIRPPYSGASRGGHVSPLYADAIDSTVTWETVAWIRSFVRTPGLIKGFCGTDDGHGPGADQSSTTVAGALSARSDSRTGVIAAAGQPGSDVTDRHQRVTAPAPPVDREPAPAVVQLGARRLDLARAEPGRGRGHHQR